METQKTLIKKLFDIQKSISTFATSEGSAKVNGQGKSEYQYTPGYKIVEDIRSKMDQNGIMLLQDVTKEENKLIEYPLYKLINGTPMSFIKKEIHMVLTVEYTWVDVESGEREGPFHIVASGANGTDKSCASALSLAERYFLLKFFHITTREKDDEPDAHDSGNLPGIASSDQPRDAMAVRSYTAAPAPMAGAAPQQGGPVSGNYSPHPGAQPVYNAPGTGNPPTYRNEPVMANTGQFNPNVPEIAEAINKLANYDKGTSSHQLLLNEIIGQLSQKGYACFMDNFLDNLVEHGQAKRENRQPNYITR